MNQDLDDRIAALSDGRRGDAFRRPHGLHPHPVPGFLSYVVAQILQATLPPEPPAA